MNVSLHACTVGHELAYHMYVTNLAPVFSPLFVRMPLTADVVGHMYRLDATLGSSTSNCFADLPARQARGAGMPARKHGGGACPVLLYRTV